MVKQLLINGEVNRFTTTNRARQAIAFQYVTQTKTLRLLDTYTNTSVNIIANGDNAISDKALEYIWEHLQDKVQGKVAGAFKFRGNVASLDDVVNPKAGDIYQVTISTGQYNPNTGQLIPSTVQYNDKEFCWAEKSDPNTGLPIGGQWVELGFNMSSDGGMVTQEWVEQYMQTKQQAAIQHEELSTYINTISGDLKGYINLTAQNLSTYVDETATGLSTYVDETAAGISTYVDDVSNEIYSYISNTVSTSIIYYVNEKVSFLSGAVDTLREYTDAQDAALSTAIDELSTALETGIQEAKDYTDEQITTLDTKISGTFDTLSATLDVKFADVEANHRADLTFYEYDNEGNLINHGGILPTTP